MDCPFCGKEMKEGLIASNDRIAWRDKHFADTVVLSGYFDDYAKAFFCPDCQQVILPVPEKREGVLGKLRRRKSE